MRRLPEEPAKAQLTQEEMSMCYDPHDAELLSASAHNHEAVADLKKYRAMH